MQLALRVCNRQDPAFQRETLVLTDSQLRPGFRAYFRSRSRALCGQPRAAGELRLGDADRQPLPSEPFQQLLASARQRYQCNPAPNTRLLHDVDLFLFDGDALRRHYQYAVQHDLDCLGASPVWDDWYRANGQGHVVATWELLFRTEWARHHAPWVHRAQYGTVDGKGHSFDMMLLAQSRSDPARIRQSPHEPAFIHFSHVISTYRQFQRHRGSWEDDYFRLLLIRLLIDALDHSGWRYELPSLAELQSSLVRGTGRITYATPACRTHYPEFRDKLERLLASDLLDGPQVRVMRAGVEPFDRTFLSRWLTRPPRPIWGWS